MAILLSLLLIEILQDFYPFEIIMHGSRENEKFHN